jgi:hypothetical protein
MDLASNYRSLVRTHFPNAKIVADRFHVIRIVNHHFLNCCATSILSPATTAACCRRCAATATICAPINSSDLPPIFEN